MEAGTLAAVLFPCGTCGLPVSNEDPVAYCNSCDLWQHCNCVDLAPADYAVLQAEDDGAAWFCILLFADCSFITTSCRDSIQSPSFKEPTDCFPSKHVSLYYSNCRSLLPNRGGSTHLWLGGQNIRDWHTPMKSDF